MNVYQGKSVFGGIAIGHLCVYKKGEQQVTRQKIADVEAEVKRFQDAKEAAQAQLGELYDKAVREVGEANAAIFEMHQMLLEDEDYQDSVENIIRTQQVNAEYATAITSDHFSSMFAEMDDDYMKERAADIRDISERVIANLNGENKSKVVTDEPVIILADDLAPSETVQLEKDKVLSFVTVHGSVNSHTAILARTMGIPALVSTEMELTDDLDGKLAVVDGNHGVIYVEPDAETMEIAEMVLNKVNKNLVRMVEELGVRAIGVSGKDGGLLRVDKKLSMTGQDVGFVGDIKKVNAEVLLDLLDKDFLPIVCPVGIDDDYNTYNINADDAAYSIAKAVHAEKLAFLSDIEGVYRDYEDKSSLITALTVDQANELIESGAISGGMIPKLQNCVGAIENGVSRVHILDGRIPHCLLLEIFTKKGIGTAILRNGEED